MSYVPSTVFATGARPAALSHFSTVACIFMSTVRDDLVAAGVDGLAGLRLLVAAQEPAELASEPARRNGAPSGAATAAG